jgi:hypothetical protein
MLFAHLSDLRAILFDILGPILLLVSLGALTQRLFNLDVNSLSKLTLYLFTPAFMFDMVSNSRLSWGEMGGVTLVTMLQIVGLGMLMWGGGKLFRVPTKTLTAVALSVMFYNSGNYGLPLARLAWPGDDGHDGAAVQAFVALTQNLMTYTLGFAIVSRAHPRHNVSGLKAFLRLPYIPTIILALLAHQWITTGHRLPVLISATAHYLSDGLVPVALITLGAQMAIRPRWPRWKPVSVTVFLRLIFAPMAMLGLLCALHVSGIRGLDLWPWPAQEVMLTAGTPSAVATLLITLEAGGDGELSADCVFWTTVLSAITVTAWLLVIRVWLS